MSIDLSKIICYNICMKVSQPVILLDSKVLHPLCPICGGAFPGAKMGSHARTHAPKIIKKKKHYHPRVAFLNGQDAI
jgi:hypothetical protein